MQEMSEWVEYMTFDGISPMADLRKKNGQEKPWRVDYFGVGNENWGCGGNMTPDQYAHEYRRYQTYVRTYDQKAPIFKICGGADSTDYEWTETVLHECFRKPCPPQAHGYMDGYSVHYYVGAEKGEHKGSATEFDETAWYESMKRAQGMEELICRHAAIMDQYDPEKKIGMMIDEWGCWHDCEPGTNPGFLYQQNTMRDAVIAGLTLDCFNRHCDRVKMGCIAQVVNVLQSMLLTEGSDMIKTPTYHVFHMYRYHQDADLLESTLQGAKKIGQGAALVTDVQHSASVDQDGIVTVTLTNLSLEADREVEILLNEKDAEVLEAAIVHGRMNDYNTFEEKDRINEESFTEYIVQGRRLCFTIPACSVMMIRLK